MADIFPSNDHTLLFAFLLALIIFIIIPFLIPFLLSFCIFSNKNKKNRLYVKSLINRLILSTIIGIIGCYIIYYAYQIVSGHMHF